MKKVLSLILATALTCAGTVCAFAAEPVEPSTIADTVTNGAYVTSGSNESYAEAMMTLLVYKDNTDGVSGKPLIDVNSIQYIDQGTADANGAYSFKYIPKSVAKSSETFKVYIGSSALETKVPAGEIVGESDKFLYIGKIESSASSLNVGAAITMTAADSTVYTATADTATGEFTVAVPAGVYDVNIVLPGHLNYGLTSLAIADDITEDSNYKMLAGDVYRDSNNIINTIDISTLLSVFTQDTGTDNVNIDVNADGKINATDLSKLLANINQSATVINRGATE